MAKFVLSDGRVFTDYTPNCVLNKALKKENMTSLEYRKYLQANAEEIMRVNFKKSAQSNNSVCNCSECDGVVNLFLKN